ncbi:MAG: hypothetical protein ACHQ4H_05300, partial [Ktedonobacterales bacterium]
AAPNTPEGGATRGPDAARPPTDAAPAQAPNPAGASGNGVPGETAATEQEQAAPAGSTVIATLPGGADAASGAGAAAEGPPAAAEPPAARSRRAARRQRAPRIPKQERTRGPGLFARLFHWGR